MKKLIVTLVYLFAITSGLLGLFFFTSDKLANIVMINKIQDLPYKLFLDDFIELSNNIKYIFLTTNLVCLLVTLFLISKMDTKAYVLSGQANNKKNNILISLIVIVNILINLAAFYIFKIDINYMLIYIFNGFVYTFLIYSTIRFLVDMYYIISNKNKSATKLSTIVVYSGMICLLIYDLYSNILAKDYVGILIFAVLIYFGVSLLDKRMITKSNKEIRNKKLTIILYSLVVLVIMNAIMLSKDFAIVSVVYVFSGFVVLGIMLLLSKMFNHKKTKEKEVYFEDLNYLKEEQKGVVSMNQEKGSTLFNYVVKNTLRTLMMIIAALLSGTVLYILNPETSFEAIKNALGFLKLENYEFETGYYLTMFGYLFAWIGVFVCLKTLFYLVVRRNSNKHTKEWLLDIVITILYLVGGYTYCYNTDNNMFVLSTLVIVTVFYLVTTFIIKNFVFLFNKEAKVVETKEVVEEAVEETPQVQEEVVEEETVEEVTVEEVSEVSEEQPKQDNTELLEMLNEIDAKVEFIKENMLYKKEETECEEEAIAEEVVEETTEEVVAYDETLDEEETTEEEVVAHDEVLEVTETEESLDEEETEEDEEALVNEDGLVTMYKKSFAAKLCLSSDLTRENFSEIKNAIMSCSRINTRISWDYDSFNYKRKQLFKINVVGKSLRVYFNIDDDVVLTRNYHLKEKTTKKYQEVSSYLNIKSNRALKYCLELINLVMESNNIEKDRVSSVDYKEQYSNITFEDLQDSNQIKEYLAKKIKINN